MEPFKVSSLDFYRSIEDLIAMDILSVGLGIVIIIVSRKCTLRIYHNPLKNNYISVFPSVIPFKTVKINFDKAVKDNSFSFLFKDVSYKLGTRKAFLLDHYFKCPMDFSVMLGEPPK